MKAILASNGTTAVAAAKTELEFRRCDDGTVHVFPVGKLDPTLGGLNQETLPGSAIARISASAEKSKSGTVRVVLRVKVQVPVTNAVNASGNMSVTNQEITLHVVLAAPPAFVNAIRGSYAVADSSHAAPSTAATAALAEAIALLVSVLTNQTVDVAGLISEMSSLPVYQGLLGVCPLNEDSGEYGTTWLLPPAAS